jgi:hypothetical protein
MYYSYLGQKLKHSNRNLEKQWKKCFYPTLRDITKSVTFCDGCQMLPLVILKKDYKEENDYGALVEWRQVENRVSRRKLCLKPRGFQKFGAPTFQDNQHVKVVSLSALHTSRLCPQEIFLVLISVKILSRTPWSNYGRKDYVSEKFQ